MYYKTTIEALLSVRDLDIYPCVTRSNHEMPIFWHITIAAIVGTTVAVKITVRCFCRHIQ